MAGFVGRSTELALLAGRLERVADGEGLALAIRGRRQVGKSRLVQEFCDRADVPYLYFTASKGFSPVESIAALRRDLGESTMLAKPELLPEKPPLTWPDAFRMVGTSLPDRPCVVVFDEVPWLAEQDPTFEGALQTAWDRLLSRHPVLLLLLGSDLHMMERMTAYDRPFYGRADNLLLNALNPAEAGAALGLDPAQAIDAHLITGGLPGILRSWPAGTEPLTFLRQQCADPSAPLFSVPEQALLSVFPAPDLARRLIEAVGSGDRTQATISAAAANSGSVTSGSLSPLLRRLVEEKRVLALDQPLSTRPGKPGLYRVADSNLRFYLAALRSAHELTKRGRPDAAFELISRRWASWRGRAVEPLIRESLELAAIDGLPWPETKVVGGWWNRQFKPEIDLVGADRSPVAGRIDFLGSIKWLASPIDRHDVAALRHSAVALPGYEVGETGFVMVSQSGRAPDVPAEAVDLWWTPTEVIAAYPSGGDHL